MLQYGQLLTIHRHPGGVFVCRSCTWVPFLQPPISKWKRVWRLSSAGHEMSPQEILGCWGRCFVVMVQSTPFMEFLGCQASLGYAGCSARCSDLAACVLLGGHGGRFESRWWWSGACTVHTVCEVSSQVPLRARCPQDSKTCCATWGTAVLHWALKQLHEICGWGMRPYSVLRVNQQCNVNATTGNWNEDMSPKDTVIFIYDLGT